MKRKNNDSRKNRKLFKKTWQSLLIKNVVIGLIFIYLFTPEYITWQGFLPGLYADRVNSKLYAQQKKQMRVICVEGRPRWVLESLLVYPSDRQEVNRELYDHYLILTHLQPLKHSVLWHMYVQYDENNTVEKCLLHYEDLPRPEKVEILAHETGTSYPSLRGYGTLPGLDIAMSLDNDLNDPSSLASLVTALNRMTFGDIFNDDLFNEDIFSGSGTAFNHVRNILFRWAGVDKIDPASRGPNIDARELASIEKLTETPFVQQGIYRNPSVYAAQDLRRVFNRVQNRFYARLILQITSMKPFQARLRYDPVADRFSGIVKLGRDALETLVLKASGTPNSAAFWSNVVGVIEHSVGLKALEENDRVALQAAINTTNPSLTLNNANSMFGQRMHSYSRKFGWTKNY